MLLTIITVTKVALLGQTPLTASHVRQALAHAISPRPAELNTQQYADFIFDQDGKPIATDVAVFDNLSVASTLSSLPTLAQMIGSRPQVLSGHAGGGEKWIEIDLSDQKLYGWAGNNKVYEFSVSTGRKWTPTVEGEFRIWIKLKSTRMRGGSRERGDYYDLPNVPYTMFFHKGYGIHGTYWHNNFGTPMSHGCVNLRTEDAKLLFDWAEPVVPESSWTVKPTPANPGTRVVVHS